MRIRELCQTNEDRKKNYEIKHKNTQTQKKIGRKKSMLEFGKEKLLKQLPVKLVQRQNYHHCIAHSTKTEWQSHFLFIALTAPEKNKTFK